ncbi:uncharacterized protein LOC129606505 [Condylostylus longicornis]|uniref:uncharacterized protein LOC129606505 n=1 Tax=Condylostylus longicornis TaxID=2530218 RepID=UPI00244E3E18|nr:uncharacterized protein LOC129606505 [Condylostylus longicornis]
MEPTEVDLILQEFITPYNAVVTDCQTVVPPKRKRMKLHHEQQQQSQQPQQQPQQQQQHQQSQSELLFINAFNEQQNFFSKKYITVSEMETDKIYALNGNKFEECKSKSPAPPPFMHQAAGADFQPLDQSSVIVDCNDCGSKMPSRVFYEDGFKTHISALVMCFLGLWCCAPLPYYLKGCRTANHYCGNCDNYLGNYPIKYMMTG